MVDNPSQFHRRSIRLKDYDYSSPGAYFVTVVTYQRRCIFGEIVECEIRLNPFGQIVAQKWEWLPTQYPYVNTDSYIVMPNHFHGILQINESSRGGSRPAPTMKIKPLGQLIGLFKTVSAKYVNLFRGTPGIPVWQRNYYEHIIRDQDELINIHSYILSNSDHWSEDPEYVQ
jgi:REP element-mobilizing transposase RayT